MAIKENYEEFKLRVEKSIIKELTEDGPKLSAPHSKIRHTEGD